MQQERLRPIKRGLPEGRQMVLAIRDLKQGLALDPFQIGNVTSHGLTGCAKLLTCLGQVQVPTHAHKCAQHGNSDAAGTLGLVQIDS